ncbi:hypothetical protein HYS95_01345 [Candidatus Daviesbacteria bacterium]|nr:hypothetical protein [Candidatus Daviesbacteria bacterium]
MTRKEWLIAAIFTFILIVAWVIFDVLHTRAEVEVPQKVQEVIEPINPNFNIQVLETQP